MKAEFNASQMLEKSSPALWNYRRRRKADLINGTRSQNVFFQEVFVVAHVTYIIVAN